MNKKKESDSLIGISKEIAPYLGMGVQLAATIVIMLFIGNWLDKKFDEKPLFTIIFAILGVITGMYNLIRTALSIGKKSNKQEK